MHIDIKSVQLLLQQELHLSSRLMKTCNTSLYNFLALHWDNEWYWYKDMYIMTSFLFSLATYAGGQIWIKKYQ